MDTQHFFGGGGGTTLHVVSVVIVLIAAILIGLLPRRDVFVPLLFATALVPITEQVVVAGVHLTLSRILLLLALIRRSALNQAEASSPPQNRIDKVFLLYCASAALTYIVLWSGESAAIINRLGFLLNACGMYFVVRALVRTEEDVSFAFTAIIWLFILIGAGMINQRISGTNFFSILGGVAEASDVRNGRIRAQGPFVHPLTAGAIGSAVLPLAFGLWWVDNKFKRKTLLGVGGIAAGLAVGITSNSSTALLTIAAAVLGLLLWPLRRFLSGIRWAVLLTLVLLHMVMKAPVWALIGRIDLTGSSSGYHRYTLVDQFIRRFSEWWLVGTQTTANWGWDMWDTINSYVNAGTSGGLITFLLFIGLLTVSFQELGKTRKAQPERARQLWVLGAMLFAQTVAFFGIEYFDQSQFVWYASLAVISSAVGIRQATEPAQVESPREVAASEWFC